MNSRTTSTCLTPKRSRGSHRRWACTPRVLLDNAVLDNAVLEDAVVDDALRVDPAPVEESVAEFSLLEHLAPETEAAPVAGTLAAGGLIGLIGRYSHRAASPG